MNELVKKTDIEKTIKEGEVFPEEITNLINSNAELDIKKMYHDAFDELVAQKASGDLEKLATNKVKTQVRKATRKAEFKASNDNSNKGIPEVRAGFIIGDVGMFDKIIPMINKARKYVTVHGLEAAKEAQIISRDEVDQTKFTQVLDTRETMFGKPNEQFGKPLGLNQHERSRTVWMIAKANGTSDYKFGTLQTNDNVLALGWGKLKYFKPCQVPMIVKEDGVEEFKANSSTAADTKSIFKALNESEIDVDAVFDQVITPQLTEVKDIERTHELTKDAWSRHIFVKGIVDYISDRPTPIGTIRMRLMSEDCNYEIWVEVPSHVPIEFGQSSTVVVIGKTERGSLKDEDDEGKTVWKKGQGEVQVKAYGFYCVPNECTPKSSGTTEMLGEEEPIDGWVS